ncbi:MAG: SPFH domain-containing protein, partial [Cetobacterium sp.]
DVINTKMRAVLDEATDPWGIKINRVELKNILPPKEIQIAMERQMKAERERREAILIAEGQKRSAILVAEGQKESEILRAEAEKLATILRADGQKEATIKGAEAESEAIVALQRAKAEGIKALNEAMITKEVLTLKGMETFEKVADGQSTKLIIPSEIQNLVNFSSIFK